MMNRLLFLLLSGFCIQSIAYAQDGTEQLFPFDKPCLVYNKETFKTGEALIDLMLQLDFPQYCTLYVLSDYQIKEKWENGYFIIGAKPGIQHAEVTQVFLKTDKVHRKDELLKSYAFFTGNERFIMDSTHQEQEFYTFQEISF